MQEIESKRYNFNNLNLNMFLFHEIFVSSKLIFLRFQALKRKCKYNINKKDKTTNKHSYIYTQAFVFINSE
jgi:hypothetical protein